jgi:hypothetical protein
MKVRPAVKPIASSCMTSGMTIKEVSIAMFGGATWDIINAPKAKDNTIRTCKGNMRDPKKGAEIKNAPARKFMTNTCKSQFNRSCI